MNEICPVKKYTPTLIRLCNYKFLVNEKWESRNIKVIEQGFYLCRKFKETLETVKHIEKCSTFYSNIYQYLKMSL